ncbi:putative metal ion binding protein [Trypoxylus dichotomus]
MNLENDEVNDGFCTLEFGDGDSVLNPHEILHLNSTNISPADILDCKETVNHINDENERLDTREEAPNSVVSKNIIEHHGIEENVKKEPIEEGISNEIQLDNIKQNDEIDIKNNQSEIVQEIVEISKETFIQSKNDEKVIEEVPKPSTKEIVSFNDDLDIDDSVLNQYLDELEEEYHEVTIVEENELAPEIPKIENIIEKGEEIIEEKTIKEPEEIKKTVEKPDEIKDTQKEITEVEKDTESAPIPEETIPAKETKETPTNEEEIPRINESESVTIVKEAEEVEIIEETDQKDTESVSSIERPTVLELTSKVLEEPPKREINLIGDPGSTPYNNVYISKELQTAATAAQKATDKESSSQDESETSPSVSPTFSEASTEVLTDSTETESEDDDERTDLHAQRQKEAARLAQNEATPVNVKLTAADFSAGGSASGQNSSSVMEMENARAIGAAEANLQPIETSGGSNQDNAVGFWLGKEAPLWIPDSDALSCLHCDARFTVIKRRHHCRACGLVLCSKCCNLKYRLEYLDAEARVCSKCFAILNMDTNSSSGSEVSQTNSPNRQPNPNNPMEYCSVVPPMQQVGVAPQNPPTVMVPVGVLKRKGSAKGKSNKSVMFCDGIRPGSDLTKLDTDFNYSVQHDGSSKKPTQAAAAAATASKVNRNIPSIDPHTKSFIPSGSDCLPPTVTVFKSDITYIECNNGENIVETLKCEKLTFALQRNLHVHVKIINMDCCINKKAWCFSTEGLISVGQDEIVYVIELMDDEKSIPVDIFHHINSIYSDAVKGTTVTEMGLSLHNNPNFLGFKNHAGFLYIRPSFQCLQNIIRPSEPYLIGLLIHRWETPWAKIFPLRLVLRLGAEYRYYPSPIISTRHRDSVFVEVGHTIINILADFRNFSYTLPNIRGLTIHMEDKNTTVTIPENRYDQVMKSLSDSSDHTLAFGGNFSTKADSHLVCVQDTQASSENSYTTHAINILNKPRKVTGASFIVFNGALKSSSGLTAKSSIIEDGLMIQIPSENLTSLRDSLRNMKNFTIQCGCINAPSDETVNIVWGESDTNFNIGVTSPIDNEPLSGVPSIRVHNGKDFVCNSGNRLIRWTEVFILQNTDEHSKAKDPIDISKISESISKATCQALVKYLDLLTSNNFYKIGIRTTLHVENVSYSAGSNNIKLPPIYMKNLDNELIPVLHRITSNNLGDNAITLELIFRILNT